jgi:hypothetical protein
MGKQMKKFMVVERFKAGRIEDNYALYNEKGRMLPEGLYYLNSWVNRESDICFQLMESNDPTLFKAWFKRWEEYVDFELYPID